MNKHKQMSPPGWERHYWFIAFDGGEYRYFDGEELLTQQEFRERAPDDQIDVLDEAQQAFPAKES